VIVVDANVIVYWATDSPQADQVDVLRSLDADWYTTPLWRYEFSYALVVMLRAKVIATGAASKALAKAESVMTAREQPVAQDDVLSVAIRYGISGYDAQYIALAHALGSRCVTADVPLVRKTPGVSTLLADVANRKSI
jgi:predicted nucleic acid-binding protein